MTPNGLKDTCSTNQLEFKMVGAHTGDPNFNTDLTYTSIRISLVYGRFHRLFWKKRNIQYMDFLALSHTPAIVHFT